MEENKYNEEVNNNTSNNENKSKDDKSTFAKGFFEIANNTISLKLDTMITPKATVDLVKETIDSVTVKVEDLAKTTASAAAKAATKEVVGESIEEISALYDKVTSEARSTLEDTINKATPEIINKLIKSFKSKDDKFDEVEFIKADDKLTLLEKSEFYIKQIGALLAIGDKFKKDKKEEPEVTDITEE